MRTPFVAANWKMQKTLGEARAFAEQLAKELGGPPQLDAAVAAPFTALAALGSALEGTGVALAAQNVHPEPAGAYTGEISVGMLADVGCSWVILGHSERRALFGETNSFISSKLAAVQAAGLGAIVCVGESLEEREAERTLDVIRQQLEGSLTDLDPAKAAELVVAYEPVWAIGTGRTATPELAQEVHGAIRAWLADRVGNAADQIRLQYGGSVKPDNARTLLAQPDIDGALVGGASLDPASFCAILRSGPKTDGVSA